ncbi:hypothetical protein ACROYT_G040325 [Oculina patagonica]
MKAVRRSWGRTGEQVEELALRCEGVKRQLMMLMMLLMATSKIQLRKTKRGKESARRIDAAKLKVPEIKTAFQLELRNRFQALEEKPGEHDLSNFHQTVCEAGEAILGFRRRKKEEWIQQGTMDKINKRKQMKVKINSTDQRG